MNRKAVLACLVLLSLAWALAGSGALAQGAGVTVYLRNISGYSVDYSISDTTTPGQWASVPNGGRTQFWVRFGQYFHYRYTGGSIVRNVPVGEYPYVASWWKLTPGPNDPGVTDATGNITLLGGPTAPNLEGDPESSDPNVARQPAGGAAGGGDVGGQIGVVWRSLGGAAGTLGNPAGGEVDVTSSKGTQGRSRNFAGGQVFWHGAGRLAGHAFALYGDIGAFYRSINGAATNLGFPVNNEGGATPSPQGTSGRWQPFEGGILVWHAGGAHARKTYIVEGAICTLYQNMGGTGSWLGMPLSHEYSWNGGRRSDFEGGYIFWTSAQGAQAYR